LNSGKPFHSFKEFVMLALRLRVCVLGNKAPEPLQRAHFLFIAYLCGLQRLPEQLD
jgi:hypothetical protein